MKLSSLFEDDNVSLIGKLLLKLKTKNPNTHVLLDFSYENSDPTVRQFFRKTSIYGRLDKVKDLGDGSFELEFADKESRDSDYYMPGSKLVIDRSFDDILQVVRVEDSVLGHPCYEVTNQPGLSESVDDTSLIWKAINKVLKNPDADVDFNVPNNVLSANSKVYRTSRRTAGFAVKGRVIGALKGNRINILKPSGVQLTLTLTPEMDSVLLFKKQYPDEESYIVRAL